MIIHPYLEKTHLQYLHPEKSSKMPSEIGFWTSRNTTPPLTFQHFSSSSIGQYIIKTHLPYYVSQFFTCVGTKKAAPLLENHGFPHYAIVDPPKKSQQSQIGAFQPPFGTRKFRLEQESTQRKKRWQRKHVGRPGEFLLRGCTSSQKTSKARWAGLVRSHYPPAAKAAYHWSLSLR